jgi:hypothetical protein
VADADPEAAEIKRANDDAIRRWEDKNFHRDDSAPPSWAAILWTVAILAGFLIVLGAYLTHRH